MIKKIVRVQQQVCETAARFYILFLNFYNFIFPLQVKILSIVSRVPSHTDFHYHPTVSLYV